MFRRYRSGHGERGQSLVEFVIVSLFLLLPILAGVVDLGRAFNSYIIITNGSREGARYASRQPYDLPGIEGAVIREAEESGITSADFVIVVDNLGAPAGSPIRVTVTYPFSTIMGGILGIDIINLTATTEMVVFVPD